MNIRSKRSELITFKCCLCDTIRIDHRIVECILFEHEELNGFICKDCIKELKEIKL